MHHKYVFRLSISLNEPVTCLNIYGLEFTSHYYTMRRIPSFLYLYSAEYARTSRQFNSLQRHFHVHFGSSVRDYR